MPTEPTVGERLKAERERQGLQRVDVARATKIWVHQLLALEFGNVEEFPEPGAAEASLRSYAEHLGLDGPTLVRDFRRERGLPEDAPLPAPSGRGGRWTRSPRWIAVGAVAVLAAPILIAVTWWASRGDREAVVPAEHVPVLSEPAPTPTPVPSPSPARPAPIEPHGAAVLSVAEHGVGTAVVDHRLVGVSDRFPEGIEVWFWTDVRGGAKGDTVRHVWMKDGVTVQTVPLPLGGVRWRTQSSRVLHPGSAGTWTVEARDGDGNLVARDAFECVR